MVVMSAVSNPIYKSVNASPFSITGDEDDEDEFAAELQSGEAGRKGGYSLTMLASAHAVFFAICGRASPFPG